MRSTYVSLIALSLTLGMLSCDPPSRPGNGNQGSSDCPTGQTRCGMLCANLQSSDQDCGACGNACPSGMSCQNGQCGQAQSLCPSGQASCDGLTCQDVSSDPMNCGACGNVCANDEVCANGNCRTYRPGRGCTMCPCTADPRCQGPDSHCCLYQSSPICVNGGGSACP